MKRSLTFLSISALLFLLLGRAVAAQIPADTCALTLDVPDGASIVVDGRDYGMRRELTFEKLAPAKTYTSRILIRFPDGREAQRMAFLQGGRRVSVAARVPSRIVYTWESDNGSLGIWSIIPGETRATKIVLGDENNNWVEPSISPDGGKLAAVRAIFGEEKSRRELWVMDIDGANAQRVVENFGTDVPKWSPDSRSLLFSRTPGANIAEIVSVDFQGRQRLLNSNGYSADYSPDGTQIVFTRTVGTSGGRFRHDLYVMNADSSGERRILENRTFGEWSPTGDRILYVKPWDEVFTANPDGTGDVRLFSDLSPMGGQPRWSPDGVHLAAMRGAKASRLYVMRSNGQESHSLSLAETMGRLLPGSAPSNGERKIQEDFCWSPDGAQLALIWESIEAFLDGDQFGRLVVCSPDGTGVRILLPVPSDGRIEELDWR